MFNFTTVKELKEKIIIGLRRRGVFMDKKDETLFQEKAFVLVMDNKAYVIIKSSDSQQHGIQKLAIDYGWERVTVNGEPAYLIPVAPSDTK